MKPDDVEKNIRFKRDNWPLDKLRPNKRPELPEPENRVLELKLDRMLGDGKTGVVHSVNVVGEDNTPSLCVKIAFPAERRTLSAEAWYYDDLQLVQGSAIPLCYGYFEATLPTTAELALPEHAERFPTYPVTLSTNHALAPPDIVPGRIGILLLERLSDERLPLNQPFDQNAK